MMPLAKINEMLRLANTENRIFSATILYNEGWLLRLVLDWFSRHRSLRHPLNFTSDARWFSEALLRSQFFARQRGDHLAETSTHADGVVGHVIIGQSARANTKLAEGATQFIVTEAKLFSRLSPGVKHAPYFDQAARSIACIAEVLFRALRWPEDLSSLGFFVLAPSEQVKINVFKNELTKESIQDKVLRRVSEYPSPDRETKDEWRRDWFLPTVQHMKIECLCWEEIIESLRTEDVEFGSELFDFYAECLRFNRVQEPDLTADSEWRP
jgi:hypothetical protein